MQFLITQRTTTTPGPNVTFDCPACKSDGVAGETAAVEELNRLFGLVPLMTSDWVTIRCGSCRRYFASSPSPDELAQMSRSDVSEMIANWQATNVDFLVKFCVIVSIVGGVVPFLGVLFGLIGVLCTFKSRSRWRIAAQVGVGISLLSTLAVIVFVMIPNHKS